MKFCQTLTNLLWPLHRLFGKVHIFLFVTPICNLFVRLSPVVDYHDAYPQLGPKLLKNGLRSIRMILTDHYKHLRSSKEIEAHLQKCGMVDIETIYDAGKRRGCQSQEV